MLTQLRLNSLINFLVACLLAGLFAACGGGGTNDGCVNVDPTRNNTLPGCGVTTSPGGGTTASATLAMSLLDPAGAATISLMPDAPGTVKVVLKDARGQAVPNAVVSFSTTDNTGLMSPSSGTAMTDGNGAAGITLAAGNQAGAFTLTANAVVSGAPVTASKTYTVSFPVLTLSDITVTPSTLPAGGNASLTVSVKNGTVAYTPALQVALTSGCAAAGKASISSPVTTQNGTAVASYTDKGCSTSDTITATVVVPNATLTKSATINVLPAVAGSIKFVGVSSSSVALKGTGGAARPENSIVTFQVLDKNGIPVAGKLVNFQFADSNSSSTTGGLSLSPSSATTGADGTVLTSVANGTIPTSVRVVATVAGSSPSLTTVSSLLVVSSGVPDLAHFAFGITTGNCEGWDYNLTCGTIEVLLGDHFSNQVPDGTVVNFTTEGGVVIDSCSTASGRCQVPLFAANPRPANGRLTVMAYVIGEENFTDVNGNNVYDQGEPFGDLKPDIYRDDNEDGQWTQGEPCVSPKANISCNTPGDGVYNGVLRVPQQSSAQTQYLSRQFVVQFSTSDAVITIVPDEPSTITCPAGGTADVLVTVKDKNGNWMPADTTIAFTTLFGTIAAPVVPAAVKVPNVLLAVGQPAAVKTYTATIACPNPSAKGQFIVTVRTPIGVETIEKAPIN